MLIKKISFLDPDLLETIPDIENYNLDGFVELEDGYTCTVTVATPKNLMYLMNKEKADFFTAGDPFIIVRKITKEIIKKAIIEYAKYNAYWLKYYHFGSDIDISVFDKLQAEDIEDRKEFDRLYIIEYIT